MKNQLKIIYYHEVVEKGQGYSYQKIEKEKFEEQMRYLHKQGYRTLFFSELNGGIPDQSIIVSFDDGFRSVYDNAASIMEAYGIRGNIYLPTAYVDVDAHFMTWDMVKELYEKKQFEMQAHTHNHVDVRALNKESIRTEIEASDRIFLERLGYLPEALCLPFGVYDRVSVKTLKELSRYNCILGSYYGGVSFDKLHSPVLPRIGISNDDSMETFIDKLEGRYDWKGPLQRARLLLHNLRKDRITEYEY